jgi:hypothetical protein
MLVISDLDTLDKSELNIVRKKTKKTQIFLYDTERRIDDFVNKIKHRKNGKYENIPHFIVSKLGQVYEVYDSNYSCHNHNDLFHESKMIKIAIENLGWLNKNTITGVLNNWIGDPYRAEPFIRNWRNYYFWDKYTEEQTKSLSQLCDFLCDKHKIYKQTVPSQGYMENVSNFKGVVCKSNFSTIYTDINPSFKLEGFFEYAKENENRI